MSRLVETVVPKRLGRPFRWLLASSWVTNLGDGIALAAGPLLYLFTVLALSQVTQAASTIACLAVLVTVVGIAAAMTILAAAAKLDDA